MVKELGPTHPAMPTEGPEISVAFEVQTVLLDTHVTHTKAIRHVANRQPLTPLEEIHNRKPLAPADLGDKTLHEGQPIVWPFDTGFARFSE
jgi:hypothetical protein